MIKKKTVKELVGAIGDFEDCEKAFKRLKNKQSQACLYVYLYEDEGINIELDLGIAIAAIKEQKDIFKLKISKLNDRAGKEL